MADIDVVTRFIGAINAHETEMIASLVSLDHEFVDSLGGTVRGRESVRAAWKGYFAFCPNYWVKPDEVIVGNTSVVVLGEAGGTILEAGRVLAENEWRIPAAWRAVIKGGQLKRWQVYADNKPVYDILARAKHGP